METVPPVEPQLTCTNFSKYNNEPDCNAATLAQCVSAYQIFPNGGQDCWSPVEGSEICTNPGYTPPVWLYVAGTAWCRTNGPANPHPLYRLRSSQGCSSSICLCAGSEVLYDMNESCLDSDDCSNKNNPPSGTIICCPGLTCSYRYRDSLHGAEDRNRTGTSLFTTQDFKSCASTNFATPASDKGSSLYLILVSE